MVGQREGRKTVETRGVQLIILSENLQSKLKVQVGLMCPELSMVLNGIRINKIQFKGPIFYTFLFFFNFKF